MMPVEAKTRRRLALLFAVPLAFSLLFFLANQIAEHIDVRFLQLQHLHSSLDRLLSLCKDAEIGERGLLLTGDDRYLVPLEQANASFPGETRLCRTYAKDRPALQQKVEHVIGLAQKRLAETNQVLDTQRAKGFTAALELAKSTDALGTMDLVRNSANELATEIETQQTSYLNHERTLNRSAFVFFMVGSAVMMVVLVALYNALLHFIQGRDTAEAELQTLNAELEARIDERTHELKQTNEELQQFAYVASHDLQEPLRTVTSFTQLLASRYRGKLDEDADEFIGYIVSSSQRMTDLINGLLTLVRLRKTAHSASPIRFDELLEDAKASLQAAIRESQAEIQHGPLPALIVDRVQFAQVLQNLISNSIKYRRDERPLVRVDAKRDGSYWIFSFADNGQGFEQQYADRIFALFQRLHSRDVEGTGMGLSISRKIVERHGGRIWAESTPGVGSVFHFSLPVSLELPRRADSPQALKSVG
ncbi:MAG: sensor histidine kinase [Bryobacteraceae bacterium]